MKVCSKVLKELIDPKKLDCPFKFSTTGIRRLLLHHNHEFRRGFSHLKTKKVLR